MPITGRIKIAEMLKRRGVADSDLIIVEDDVDTKQATVKDLKTNFNGDSYSPSSTKFYSSKKTNDLVSSLAIRINNLPSSSTINSLKTAVDNLTKTFGSTTGTKDPEIVAARGTYSTLLNRFVGERDLSDKSYISFPKKSFSGRSINLASYGYDNTLYIKCPASGSASTLTIHGLNYIKAKTNKKYQYTRTFIPANPNNLQLDIDNAPAGEYIFYATHTFSSDYVKDGAIIRLVYTDGSYNEYSYGYTDTIRLTAVKTVNALQIIPNEKTTISGMQLVIDQPMFTKYVMTQFVEPYEYSTTIEANKEFSLEIDLGKCILTRSSGLINLTLIDRTYDIDELISEIKNVRSKFGLEEDYCGMLESKGTYIYPTNIVVNSMGLCTVSADYNKKRNNHYSSRIDFGDYDLDDQPRVTAVLNNTIDLTNIKTVSFQIYIDKTVSECFSVDDGIKIMMSSDNIIVNPATNYFFFNVGKDSLVQGWNTIKLKYDDFLEHGTPDKTRITQINFRIFSTKNTAGKSMWLNAIILNQRMKPTVLFAFDELNETGFDYQYPYLYSKDIPATIFCNDKHTFTTEYMDKIADLHYNHNWDIGLYGCNPNKDILIEDDNAREQYRSLRETKSWLNDNFDEDIVSYAAPYGNLRPITEKILKNMGFKIAKEDADQYCSLFTAQDFVVPMHLLSNEDGKGADMMIKKIDAIMETGQVLCIHTFDVTKYGSDIAATKTSFEKVIDYIYKNVQLGKLQCLTFKDFYNKCVN